MLGVESQEAGRNFTLGRRRYIHDPTKHKSYCYYFFVMIMVQSLHLEYN